MVRGRERVDAKQQQCDNCGDWFTQLKNHETRCPGKQLSDSEQNDVSPAGHAAGADLVACCPSETCGYVEDVGQGVVSPAEAGAEKDVSQQQDDLYARVHDWLAETMQGMHQRRKDATPSPTLESELIALLLERLSGQSDTANVSGVLW